MSESRGPHGCRDSGSISRTVGLHLVAIFENSGAKKPKKCPHKLCIWSELHLTRIIVIEHVRSNFSDEMC